ncbi:MULTISPECIES: hypothetical protein [Bacteria]|uniref:hypothetical protein n=1 Tax=Bacteria TaxID=2 RepID=UPI00103DC7BF|nr:MULTISPECIES: hypothetical protein [Bacteria]QDM39971.1 hypothetical protein C0V74_02085 [Altererythrobacter sp. TH136]TCJ37484.1 hypothetical protein E0504_20905 [Parafrankia sp. BMG5.11]
MRALKLIAQIFGVALVLSGGLWALQGLGLVMWPAESFMLADRSWALYGGLTVVVGLLLIWWGSRRRA